MAAESKVVQTYCALCISQCAVLCHVENGRLVKVEPDRSHPNGQSICPKGVAAPQLVYNAQRLRHPLKRTRPKGDPDPGWVKVSWEEALAEAAERVQAVRAAHGPEAVGFYRPAKAGSPSSDYEPWVIRLASALGSPNTMSTGHICQWHRDTGSTYTYGSGLPSPDLDQTRGILLWGFNPYRTWNSFYQMVRSARQRGAGLIVVDPRRTEVAKEADHWLQVRPGTDGALALGITQVMVAEGLFDAAFARHWTNAPFLLDAETGALIKGPDGSYRVWDEGRGEVLGYSAETMAYGFAGSAVADAEPGLEAPAGLTAEGRPCRTVWQAFRDILGRYTPGRVEEITSVPAELVTTVARKLAGVKPFCYFSYNGIEQHTNAMHTNRALTTMFALTGNLQQPGGNVSFPKLAVNDVQGRTWLSKEARQKRLGVAKRPLGAALSGRVQAYEFYEAALTGEPYPVKALLSFGGNLVCANGDSGRGREALKQLDFYLQTELFLTPTAELADIVLPASTVWESWYVRDGFTAPSPGLKTRLQYRAAAIDPLPDTRPDPQIVFDLAKALGLGDRFWDGDLEAAFDHVLEPLKITVAELRKHPGGVSQPRPPKYAAYREAGFKTPTRKVEIYSTQFAAHGYAPLPDYEEPRLSPVAAPELAKDYPLVLTNGKLRHYLHGQMRSVPDLRKRAPHPTADLHPSTAAKYGLADEEWVYLETQMGRIRVQARVTDEVAPGVVSTQHGWWQSCPELDLPGYDPFSPEGANVNLIVSNEYMDPISGSISHKANLCRVVRAG